MPGRIFNQQIPPTQVGGRISTEIKTQEPAKGRVFKTTAEQPLKQGRISQPEEVGRVGIKEVAKQIPSTIGGAIGKIGDLLLTGQRISSGVARKVLGLPDKPFREGDYIDIVKELGQKIQPKSNLGKLLLGQSEQEVGESLLKGTLRELPHVAIGTIANIFLDPLLFLGKLGTISKATGTIGRTMEKLITTAEKTVPGAKITKELAGRAIVPRYAQPEAFRELDRLRLAEENMIRTADVPGLVEPIIKQSRAVQQRITQILRGGLTTKEDVRALATPIREELDRVGKSISKLSPQLLSEETFAVNKGTYFPTLYRKYEFQTPEKEITAFFAPKVVRVPGARFKAKKELSEAYKQEIGEIKEAGLPALKGLTQLKVAETRLKFFKNVADNFASDVPRGDLLQLPESKLLGDLSEKFVSPAIHRAINQISKTPSSMEKIYSSGLRFWKSMKTAYNPATIARNDLTNYFILSPLGGVQPWRLDIYAKGLFRMATGHKQFKEAQRAGLNISSFAADQLVGRASTLYNSNIGLFKGFFPTIKSFHKKVVEFYGNQDRFFKYANYIKGVEEDGLTPIQAIKRANFYLVNYAETPELINWLKNSPIGAPFISFAYGVSLPLAKTLLTRPDQLANYFKILNGIQQINPYKMTKDQLMKEYEQMPDYIKNGQYLKLPWRDKKGEVKLLDLTYILPFNILETRGTGYLAQPVVSSTIGQNPLFSLFADISRNKSGFTGREIYSDLDADMTKQLKVMKYVWQQLAPNNPLVPQSWAFSKMQDAGVFPRISEGQLRYEPRLDNLGAERSKIQALLDTVFGIKIRDIIPAQQQLMEAKKKRSQIIEIQKKMRVLNVKKDILPSEKRKQREELQLKLRELTAPEGLSE